MRTLLSFLISFFLTTQLHAQVTGGGSVYDFLNLPESALVGAKGGQIVSHVNADDLGTAFQNPALLNPAVDRILSFTGGLLPAGIKTADLAFGKTLKDTTYTWALNLHYISYGRFDQTDQWFNELGEFKANEIAITGAAGHQIGKWSYGAELKLVYSSLADYSSLGFAIDIGGAYRDVEKKRSIGLVLKNFGTQISSYSGQRESLPLDLRAGFSQRLEYLPFEFSIEAHHLLEWDIRFDDPALETNSFVLDDQSASSGTLFFDQLFRHFNFSGQLFLGKALSFIVGYNHLKRRELALTGKKGLAGFSMGIQIKLKKFALHYSLSNHHLAGASNQFTFTTNVNRFVKKKGL